MSLLLTLPKVTAFKCVRCAAAIKPFYRKQNFKARANVEFSFYKYGIYSLSKTALKETFKEMLTHFVDQSLCMIRLDVTHAIGSAQSGFGADWANGYA